MQQLAQRRHAFLGLLAQPLLDLGLIGELAHAEELTCQRVVVERLAVGETAAARAERINQLADDDLGPEAAHAVLARIQAGELARLVPKIDPAGHGLDDDEPGVDGMVDIGDELEFEASVFLGDGSHVSETKRTKINSPPRITRNDFGVQVVDL